MVDHGELQRGLYIMGLAAAYERNDGFADVIMHAVHSPALRW